MNRKTSAITLTLAAAFALGLLLPAHAGHLPTKASNLFDVKYEMDVLPTADDQGGAAGADWTVGTDGQSGGPPSVSGGVLNVNFTHPTQYFEFNNGDTGLVSFDTGYTIELRARIVTNPNIWNLSVIALPGLGHNDQIPFLHIGGATTNWGDGSLPDDQIDANANNDGFHVFRLAQEPGLGKYSVWRDGVLLSETLTSARGDLAGLGLRKIAFGDEGDAWQGSTDIDYFRFDTSGAYAPVPIPEPTALALALAGSLGLAGLIWRKRK